MSKLVILCAIFILLNICCAIKLPEEFTFKFTVYDRVTEYKRKTEEKGEKSSLSGIVTKTKDWDVGAMIGSKGEEFLVREDPLDASNTSPLYLFRSGKLMRGNQCLINTHAIPPTNVLNDIITGTSIALDPSKKAIYDAEINECLNRKMSNKVKLWVLEYAYEPIVLCSVKDPNTLYDIPFKIIGHHFIMTVDQFQAYQVNELLLDLTKDVQEKCSENQHYSATLSILDQLSMGKEIQEGNDAFWFHSALKSCQYEWIRDQKACSTDQSLSDSMNTRKKVCIFLHGAGIRSGSTGTPIIDNDANRKSGKPFKFDYWGDVHLFTPQCSERIYAREETKETGWKDIELQKQYCKIALLGQREGEKLIKNKVIFAHSMGNMILGGAIKNGFCDLDTSTTSWYAIQAPFTGSAASLKLQEVCTGQDSKRENILRLAGELIGYCDSNHQRPFGSYLSVDPRHLELQQVANIAKSRIKGSTCGTAPTGLVSKYSIPLAALSAFINFKEDNDGMVPVSSCTGASGNARYQKNYEANHYLASVNHADATCRNGDGMFGLDRKPCSYFSNKL